MFLVILRDMMDQSIGEKTWETDKERFEIEVEKPHVFLAPIRSLLLRRLADRLSMEGWKRVDSNLFWHSVRLIENTMYCSCDTCTHVKCCTNLIQTLIIIPKPVPFLLSNTRLSVAKIMGIIADNCRKRAAAETQSIRFL